MRRILVTGTSSWVGGRVVAELERRADTEVFAVDEIPPREPFRSPFVMLGDDRLAIADPVLRLEPDTIVHLLTGDRSPGQGSADAHERAVVGDQALMGAAGRTAAVRRVVVRSDAAVYPLGNRSPSVFGETDADRNGIDHHGRRLLDVEEAATDLGTRRPDVAVTVLRLAPIFGASIGNRLSRYLRLPVVPTLAGFDPRWHLLHESDAVGAVVAAVDAPGCGVVNVAPELPMYLSRIVRLGHRTAAPHLRRFLDATHRALATRGIDVDPRLSSMLRHGVVLDTSEMRSRLGFHPRLPMRDAVGAGYADPPEAS